MRCVYPSPALLSWLQVTFFFVATLLFWLTTFSVPFLDGLYFLQVLLPGGEKIRYGCFGFTGNFSIGYDILNFDGTETDVGDMSTMVLILHPIVGIISGVGFIYCACNAIRGRTFSQLFMLTYSVLTFATSMSLFISDYYLFYSVDEYFIGIGSQTKIGPGILMTLFASLSTLLSAFTAMVYCSSLYNRLINTPREDLEEQPTVEQRRSGAQVHDIEEPELADDSGEMGLEKMIQIMQMHHPGALAPIPEVQSLSVSMSYEFSGTLQQVHDQDTLSSVK